ncbi:hypothetical protein HDK64DRAFT_258433 [Phyllosticta capitalensis]
MADSVLTLAIDDADHDRLQKVLKNLCRQSEHAKALIEKELLTSEPADSEEASKDEKKTAPQGKKRPIYSVCEMCREEYDVTKNTDEACTFHDGELGPLEEFWIDTDEDVWGPIDCDENKLQFPKGFKWDCCRKFADSLGCQTGRHEENASEKKKGVKRYRWTY